MKCFLTYEYLICKSLYPLLQITNKTKPINQLPISIWGYSVIPTTTECAPRGASPETPLLVDSTGTSPPAGPRHPPETRAARAPGSDL